MLALMIINYFFPLKLKKFLTIWGKGNLVDCYFLLIAMKRQQCWHQTKLTRLRSLGMCLCDWMAGFINP